MTVLLSLVIIVISLVLTYVSFEQRHWAAEEDTNNFWRTFNQKETHYAMVAYITMSITAAIIGLTFSTMLPIFGSEHWGPIFALALFMGLSLGFMHINRRAERSYIRSRRTFKSLNSL